MHINNKPCYCRLRCLGVLNLLLISAMFILLPCSCSKSGTELPLQSSLDTTSHNFSWQIDTLGDYSSMLYDVAIAGEEIWAVGEIHTAETDTFDSLGNWVSPYNAACWRSDNYFANRIRGAGFCSCSLYFT